MTLIDILISCALMMLVLRQIRGRKLTIFSLIWPILLVGWAVIEYMTGFPLHEQRVDTHHWMHNDRANSRAWRAV